MQNIITSLCVGFILSLTQLMGITEGEETLDQRKAFTPIDPALSVVLVDPNGKRIFFIQDGDLKQTAIVNNSSQSASNFPPNNFTNAEVALAPTTSTQNK